MSSYLESRGVTYNGGVADELPGEPEEGFLEVIIRLGRNVVVLKVLLAVEGNRLGLDFTLLHVDLVTAEDDGDVLADTDQITCWALLVMSYRDWYLRDSHTVPVGNVLVCDTRSHVEHNDTALAIDVVAITEPTELLLACGIPDVELDGAEVLREASVVMSPVEVASLRLTVVKPRGWTSTPRVAMYFFSNSPVKWRLTKVV
jgi:hypothetical protein